MNLANIQAEHAEWAKYNFPDAKSYQALLGVVEEVGELSHAHLKADQSIRGTPAEHEAAAKDAVGDILIYLMHYCALRDWSMATILETTWMDVKKRDWKKNPTTGKS